MARILLSIAEAIPIVAGMILFMYWIRKKKKPVCPPEEYDDTEKFYL